MKQLIKTLTLIATVAFLHLTHAAAATVEIKGTGEVQFGAFGLNSKLEQEALQAARRDALQKHVAQLSAARRQEYSRVQAEVDSQLDRVVSVVRVLEEKKDSTSRRFTVTIRAAIDWSFVEDLIARSASVTTASSGEKSMLTFVFMSRKASSVRSFDERVTIRKETTSGEEAGESSSDDGASVSASATSTQSVSTTTGGSREIKADQILYEVRNADDINSTLTRAFTDAGFDVTEAEMVQDESNGKMSVEAFRADFSTGDDVSATTRKNAAVGCRDLDIKFLAVGALDVGQNRVDPASGLIEVYVNVNAKVYDVSGRFPKTVATIGPVQFSGLGPNQTVAERNALQLAGERAAGELVSQMRAKNLK